MSARIWKRRRNKAVRRWMNACAEKIASEVRVPFRLVAPAFDLASNFYGESPGTSAFSDAAALNRLLETMARITAQPSPPADRAPHPAKPVSPSE